MRLCVLFGHESEADPVESRADHYVGVVHYQWAVDCDGQRLFPFVELPPIHALRAVPEVDAAMTKEIARRFGLRMRFEVCARSDNRRPMVRRYTYRDHVLRDVLTELD